MFSVEKIENGFLLHVGQAETFYKNEKKLVSGIRDVLGLAKVGRPVKDREAEIEAVFNGLDE